MAAASGVPTMPCDSRQLVNYPMALRIHTLANMRDHLETMGDIQEALSKGSFDKASELAEQRLGMSSLEMHGAQEVAKYMPAGMQDAGTAMHRSASRFALVAKDASVTRRLEGSAVVAPSTEPDLCGLPRRVSASMTRRQIATAPPFNDPVA
jgi:hypothetical protein